ncbi:uncharacterized protein DNG_09090 [Cephalotrichum gorgonifer]|uniref:2EXR domain-containing protein n=1 Tax=Cephalotrichum gorgonifer TaxID=2041049 RepID=A0AAE8N507_9PEZI|nr:uncharacterized protein DNG_09090 [Cephalotrichum gorgonifer]
MAFARFSSLPPEIRWKIWEAYCPELGPQPLSLQIDIDPNVDEVRPGQWLFRQTLPVRRILSLSRDSRSYALKALPNTISLRKGRGIVRYSAQRDVIRLHPTIFAGPRDEKFAWRPVTGFSDQVVSLTFNLEAMPWKKMKALDFFKFCLSFPRLRYIFTSAWGASYPEKNLQWCASDYVHRVGLKLHQGDDPAGGVEMVYCWPSLPRHQRWAEGAIPLARFPRGESALREFLDFTNETLELMELTGVNLTEKELDQIREIRVWPLVARQGGVPLVRGRCFEDSERL